MTDLLKQFDAYKAYVVKREVRQEVLTEQLKTKTALVLEKEIYLEELVKVSEVLKHVASETQEHLKLHIDNIVSLALDSVFPDEFTFALNFVDKRGTIEADICLLKDGRESDPMDSEGGGVIDILSFSLRIAIWSLKKTSPVIILDEPFRFLSKDLQHKASLMLKELSSKLGIQFIIVSHEEAIIESADKYFIVTQNPKTGISKVESE